MILSILVILVIPAMGWLDRWIALIAGMGRRFGRLAGSILILAQLILNPSPSSSLSNESQIQLILIEIASDVQRRS